MKIAIIPADKFIGIGTTSYVGINTDWSWCDATDHAIHWDTETNKGWVEHTDNPNNTEITNFSKYQPSITHHENERLRLITQEVADQAILDNKDWDAVFRMKRSLRLENSDWTQGNDSPLSSSKKTEWATYRQTLRDLPSTKDAATRKAMSKDEDHSDWPTKPS